MGRWREHWPGRYTPSINTPTPFIHCLNTSSQHTSHRCILLTQTLSIHDNVVECIHIHTPYNTPLCTNTHSNTPVLTHLSSYTLTQYSPQCRHRQLSRHQRPQFSVRSKMGRCVVSRFDWRLLFQPEQQTSNVEQHRVEDFSDGEWLWYTH